MVPLFVTCHFSLAAGKISLLILASEFNYNVSQCSLFLCVFNLLSIFWPHEYGCPFLSSSLGRFQLALLDICFLPSFTHLLL